MLKTASSCIFDMFNFSLIVLLRGIPSDLLSNPCLYIVKVPDLAFTARLIYSSLILKKIVLEHIHPSPLSHYHSRD
jgi:hypothetical protein